MNGFLAIPLAWAIWAWGWSVYLICRILWMLLGHAAFAVLDQYLGSKKCDQANDNKQGRVFDFGFDMTIRILGPFQVVQQVATPTPRLPGLSIGVASLKPPSSPKPPAAPGSQEVRKTTRATPTQGQTSRRRVHEAARSNPSVPRDIRTNIRVVTTSTARHCSRVPSRMNTYITVIPKHRRLQLTTLHSGLSLLLDPGPRGTDDIALLTPNLPREIRVKILLLQITVTAFKRAEAVIDGLHELLLGLTPITSIKNPKPDFHAIAWACVEDEAKLRQVVRATGKLLYKEAD
ncbi:uncharacterized protein BDZ99DRAFT_479534 [Mytilinidion resinicola]|uniref:Uncharacterized protein n=1 Tax=Mytilinidion resinicola TaxID=574789 RepID=A0A6A6YBR3_9PEZI|nr:uncharacterized protein BDZ99DRAFT_479534 [Mytilinidion resinicola]KAF2806266.1 hypothetical protein BDZ99DRAFT_479534 [Mytilinidion resinicola]